MKWKVLIIAENYNIIDVHEAMFKFYGHEVQTCIDFEVLLAQVKTFLPSVIYWYYILSSPDKAVEYVTKIRQLYDEDGQPIIVIGVGYKGGYPEEFSQIADMVVDGMIDVEFFTELKAFVKLKGQD